MQPQPQPQPLALPCYTTLGSTVREDRYHEDIRRDLEASGWTRLGAGCSTTAYLSPDGTRVLKLTEGGRLGSEGQRETLDAALACPDNPHLPTVYGVLELDDGHHVVECEPLERAPPQLHLDWRHGPLCPRLGREAIEAQPDCPLKEATLALMDAFGTHGGDIWDCHGGNVMVRPSDGSLVLNDLIA